VKIFLIPLDPAPSVFYSEHETREDATPFRPERRGLPGWFDRTVRRARSSITNSEGRLAVWLKRAWNGLKRRMHPDEPLLAALRTAPALAVYHRPSLGADRVVALWTSYLRSRRRRHGFWFVVDVLLSPLSILLTPLPGPNIIGYWFAYRSVLNGLILLGIRRALSGRVETTFHALDDLEPGGHADRQWLSRAATHHELTGLPDFLARMTPTANPLQRPCDHATAEL
jgi:hypothetical protein